MIKNKKIIVIGSGITGAVVARNLAEAEYEVEIYEKRNHIGGNMYDYEKDGVLIHKYGPHIFHTSNEEVNSFMSRFWKLNDYKNIVEGYVDGKLVPIPFNFKSIDLCFPKDSEKIKSKLEQMYPNRNNVPILELKKSNDRMISDVANYIYENLFLNYTTKMWDLKPDEIDESVTARIPVILSYKNTYFNDKYEGLPTDGYTKTFERILDHKNIKVYLNIDAISLISFKNNKIIFNNDENVLVIYTGPLDKLFNNNNGFLDYRSLFFYFETHKKDNFQKTAVVNYPADPIMTRITEYKNMTLQKVDNVTVISKEFPGTYSESSDKWNEPYYPLATNEARNKYNLYYLQTKKINNLYIGGRMGLYKYLNMDQAIELAINLSRKILENEKNSSSK